MARKKKITKKEVIEKATVSAEGTESPKTAPFTMVLEVNGNAYKTSGETILECLNKIPLDYVQVKTKGSVQVTDGMQTAVKDMPLLMLRKMVASKMSRLIWSKNFTVLLR